MNVVIDFNGLNQINNKFFDNAIVDHVVSADYKDKLDLCNQFKSEMTDKLFEIGQNSKETLSALSTFMDEFVDSTEFEKGSVDSLKIYFNDVSSILNEMCIGEIVYLINCLRNGQYNEIKNMLDIVSSMTQ